MFALAESGATCGAIDANGQIVDFRLTVGRDAKAARAFLPRRLTGYGPTDRSGSTPTKRLPKGASSTADKTRMSTASRKSTENGETL